MEGRYGFFMHGDTAAQNRAASDGCIVMARAARQLVRDSPDRELIVVA